MNLYKVYFKNRSTIDISHYEKIDNIVFDSKRTQIRTLSELSNNGWVTSKGENYQMWEYDRLIINLDHNIEQDYVNTVKRELLKLLREEKLNKLI